MLICTKSMQNVSPGNLMLKKFVSETRMLDSCAFFQPNVCVCVSSGKAELRYLDFFDCFFGKKRLEGWTLCFAT